MAMNIRQTCSQRALPATLRATRLDRCTRPSIRILVLLLAFAVPGFFALARASWYLSSSGQKHFQVDASKTNVSDVSIPVLQPLLCQVAAVALPRFDEHRVHHLE